MKSIRDRKWLSIVAFIKIIGIILVAVVVAGGIYPAYAGQKHTYVIAVLPASPPVTMHTLWTPFVEQLTRETGQQYRLKLFERMADFEREIGNGTSDFIFASPIQTVVAHQMHRYIPLVRGGKSVSIGLFVRKDSTITTMGDLSSSTISFVGNKNVCSVLFRHLLSKQKEQFPFSTEYSGSTQNVIKSVLLGKSSAGAVFIPELEKEPETNQAQLRSIAETPKIAPHPLSAHPRVPRTIRELVTKTVLNMATTKEGAEQLKIIRLPEPVAADYKRDYQSLEIIDIKGLTDWGK